MNQYTSRYKSPFGPLELVCTETALCKVKRLSEGEELALTEENDLMQTVKLQLDEYFAGSRTSFTLPLNLRGTAFEKSVWSALQDIPYGETCTYGEIATAIGRPKAYRAVGMANHKNPIGIIVPCHRVIGANGKLTGYAGGLPMKAALLAMEKQNKTSI